MVFKQLRDDLPSGLADLDRDIAELSEGFLGAMRVDFGAPDEPGRVVFEIAENADFPYLSSVRVADLRPAARVA